MPLLIEPYQFFKHDVHRAIEVDPGRVARAREALALARTYGRVEVLASLFDAGPEPHGFRSDDLFGVSDDYPMIYRLGSALPEALRAPDAEDVGVGIFGSLLAQNLCVGEPLIDEDEPMSPEWLAVEPWLPHRVAPAQALLAAIDFDARVDPARTQDLADAYDMGNLPIESAGDFLVVDVVAEWERELRARVDSLRVALRDIASRDGHVMSWYDENMAL